MGKVITPNNDLRYKDDYSKSNSSHVEQNESDSITTLEPPVITFNNEKLKDQEEEEAQELQSETQTYDMPAEDDSNTGDDDSEINGDEPYTSSETTVERSSIDPDGDFKGSETENTDMQNESVTTGNKESNKINDGKPSSSEHVITFQKNDSQSIQAFSLPPVMQLKKGFEQKYGFSLADTKVVHNSPQPAQFKAHAFAKGNEVHLGPGQEQHLGHELAHVVQQKQGKVNATSVENSSPVNESPQLENEADKMSSEVTQLKDAFSLRRNTPIQQKSASPAVFQFNKPKKEKEEKVKRKISLAIPSKKILEKKFTYVSASLNLATGAEVSFDVDKSMAHLPDEIAIGEKGVAVKKEGPNLVSKEVEQKINLEVKEGIEINSFGGKVGIECKLGDESLFSGTGVEFSFIDVDWSESDPLDKIKILTTTFKAPEFSRDIPFNIQGEPYTLKGKFQLQGELQPNKEQLLKQVALRFGHLFTAEVAIAGGMVLAGAATIAAAIYTIYIGKEMEERVEILISRILEYGRSFKAGFTGIGGGSSIDAAFDGVKARLSAYKKMPAAVFDAKIKSEGMGSAFSDAMYQAVQKLKKQAIDQFKKEHDVDEDSFFRGDLISFKKRLGYLCESKYLRDRLSEI